MIRLGPRTHQRLSLLRNQFISPSPWASIRPLFTASNRLLTSLPPNTDDSTEKPTPARKPLSPFLHMLNQTLETHPYYSCVVYLGANYGIFGTFFMFFKATGFSFPSLAAAVAIAGTLKRLRLPFDIAVTPFVAKTFPILADIKIGVLLRPPPPPTTPGDKIQQQPKKQEQPQSRIFQVMEDTVNKYGAAFIVERSVVGLVTCLSLTAIIHHGVDPSSLPAFIQHLFSTDTTQAIASTSSSAAAAAMCNTLTLPLKIMAVPFGVGAILRRKQQSASKSE